MKKNINILSEIKNYFFICIGLAIFAFGWTAFMIPNQITGGGVAGISAIIYFATNTIPVGVSTLVLNIILVAIAWKVLGSKFCINTIICTIILSTFFSIGQSIFKESLVDNMFMCTVIGSGLAGFGAGLSIFYGGNTGGTDIIAMMIGKYRNISYGRVTLYANIFIVGSSYFVVHSVDKLVYSMVVMFVYIYVSDMVIDGYRQSYQFMIFSSKNQEIADKISEELHRGATFLKGYGAYYKTESDVLLIIAHKTDKNRIIKIIKDTDPTSFISVTKANSVFGKNFDRLRV